ncbi:hypothetical protein Tco_0792997 [Tanacetum coccineum]
MVAILEKTELNTDFHQIVDFLEASHIRYALTVRPTVYVSHIQQFWSTARVETVDEETKIIAKVNGMQHTVTESYIRRHLKLLDDEGISTLPDNELFENLSLMGYNISPNQRFSFQKSKAPTPGADETASPTRDDRHREAFPTATSLDFLQTRARTGKNAKTSAMPHEASPGVTSLGGGEGKKSRICSRGCSKHRGMDQGEDLMTGDVEKSTGKGSDNTNEAANVLSTLEAANVLSSGSFPTAAPAGVATASGSFPTAAIFTTASVTTPYTRRTRASRGIIIEPSHTTSIPTISTKGKGKEKMVESTSTKKKKIQEQLDAQVAKEAQAEKELRMMIAELDRSNELIAKYMTEYEQAEADLSLEEKMELITELIKVYAGWKSKDFRGMTFEQIEEKFIPVWKQLQDFLPMNFKIESERVKRPGIQLAQESSKRLKTTKASGSEPSQEHQTKDSKELFEEDLKKMMEIVLIEEVYIEDLQATYPIIEWEIYSKEQRKYWKIIRVGNHIEVYQTFEEMLKRFDRKDLDRLWSLVKKTSSTTDPTEDKEKELWVKLKRLYEPDPRDYLWALQRYIYDPLEWMLYDTCGVHHVSTERGHEIFMLVEKDYPLTKGLTTLLLCNKLQVDQYLEMANELLIKNI